jgi:hypothetical protein
MEINLKKIPSFRRIILKWNYKKFGRQGVEQTELAQDRDR